MGKSHSDADFINSLKRQSQEAGTASPMHLNRPPQRAERSWDEVLQADGAAVSPASTAATASDFSAGARDTGFYVTLDQLLAHPWNARIHRTPERVREIASSLAASRQLHPISVVPAPGQPGKYFVVDGETRWKGAAHLHWKDIWAVQVQVDPDDEAAFYFESFKQTDATTAISPIDRGLRWQQLISEQKATLELIATSLEVTKSAVSKMLAYSKFPPRIVEFMQDNVDHFPYTVASMLAPLCSDGDGDRDDELMAICRKIVDEDFSRRSIEGLLKSRSVEKRSPRRAAVVARTIKSAGQPVGSLRTYESGTIEFKLNGASIPDKAAADLTDLLQLAAELIGSGTEDLRSALLKSLADHDNG